MGDDRDRQMNDDQVFGESVVSRPEYRREQERLNREMRERLDPLERDIHRENMTGRELREKAKSWSALPWPANLSIGLEASASSISNNLIGQRDVALIDTVSDELGREDWRAHELRDRLIFSEREGVTTLMLDGRPIAKFAEPEFEVVDEEHGKVFRGKQRFWRVR